MRILIAEDEPISRHLLQKFLSQWGYEVLVANDGDEAWWTLQRDDSPNLAILDWMMPGMDGPQVCREVRKLTGRPYTYLLLLTAKAQKADVVEGLDAGADDYLTKPFDPEELRVRLRAGRRILDLQDHLLSMREAMRFPATHDFLTGVWNREAILGMLRQKLSRERRDDTPVGVILVHIDQFRRMGIMHGPTAAETVLRESARRLRTAVRVYDSIGRYGNAEFLIVVPGSYSLEVMEEAEKLRACLAQEPVDILSGTIAVTASLGAASTEESPGANVDQLLQSVSAAMLRAKSGGRNRAELADPAEETINDSATRAESRS
jgi:diguanylate cyclase (GGDEF)-like protein